MSDVDTVCFTHLEQIRCKVLDLNLNPSLDEIYRRTHSLATELNILRAWTKTINALKSDEDCSMNIKHLDSYLKFLFVEQKGNKRREPFIQKLKTLDFYTTVLTGLSDLDPKNIDFDVIEVIIKLRPIFAAHHDFLSIFRCEYIRRPILDKMDCFREAADKNRSPTVVRGFRTAKKQ